MAAMSSKAKMAAGPVAAARCGDRSGRHRSGRLAAGPTDLGSSQGEAMDGVAQRIRIGMVGGGPGAGIAETHRVAMRMDDRYSLEAGVFSRDPDRSRTRQQAGRVPR
jgi:hypothetical protein